MIWQPYFPASVLLPAGALLAALAVIAYRRGMAAHRKHAGLLLAVRLGLLALVFVLLMGPSRVPESTTAPERPLLEVWVDTSASMATSDMDGEARYEFALRRWLNDDHLARLAEDYELRLYGFDETSQETTAAALAEGGKERAAGSLTYLVDGLHRHLGQSASSARKSILLLSDGHDSEDQSPAGVIEAARRTEVPVHTVPLGGPRLERDLSVLALPRQDYLMAGEEGEVEVEILQSNAGQARSTFRVTTGGRMKSYPVAFGGKSSASVSVPVQHEEPGLYEYVFSVDPVPGEVEERNNHQTVHVEVTERRFRVLLLEGEPYWDTKFLAQALRHDERIELIQISQISGDRRETLVTRLEDESPSELPRDMEALSRFDAVILGRSVGNVTGERWLDMLPEYVGDHGGHLVMARGPLSGSRPGPAREDAGRRFSVLEPVRWGDGRMENVRMKLEPAGRLCPALRLADREDRNAMIYRSMPALEAAWECTAKTAARVLASFETFDGTQGPPALATLDYGAGSVLAVLGDGLWRWRLLDLQKKEWSGVFEQFWRSLIRWLIASGDMQPEHDVSLRLAPRHVKKGEPVTIQVSSRTPVQGEAMRLSLLAPDGTRRELALQEVENNLLRQYATGTAEQPGVYRVLLETPGLNPPTLETRFDVYEMDVERLQSSANPGLMSRLARETGGECLDPYRPERLAPVLRKWEAARAVPPRPEYIWDSARIMLLLLVSAGAEWIARRKWGWI